MKYPEYQHRFQATRTTNGGHKVKVDANLHYLEGNSAPRFGVTAEITYPGDRRPEMFGCCHEYVLAAFPELAPVVSLHLSDHDGQPMYPAQNGAYHLGMSPRFGKRKGEPFYYSANIEYAASHFRITTDQAQNLRNEWLTSNRPSADVVNEFVAANVDRWANEAKEAIALLDNLIAKQETQKEVSE